MRWAAAASVSAGQTGCVRVVRPDRGRSHSVAFARHLVSSSSPVSSSTMPHATLSGPPATRAEPPARAPRSRARQGSGNAWISTHLAKRLWQQHEPALHAVARVRVEDPLNPREPRIGTGVLTHRTEPKTQPEAGARGSCSRRGPSPSCSSGGGSRNRHPCPCFPVRWMFVPGARTVSCSATLPPQSLWRSSVGTSK
jgi:hypothetical protein